MGQSHKNQRPEPSVVGQGTVLSPQELKAVLASHPGGGGGLPGGMPDFFIPTLAAPVLEKDVAKRVQGKCFGAKPQPLCEEKELCAFLRRLITQTQEHPRPK